MGLVANNFQIVRSVCDAEVLLDLFTGHKTLCIINDLLNTLRNTPVREEEASRVRILHTQVTAIAGFAIEDGIREYGETSQYDDAAEDGEVHVNPYPDKCLLTSRKQMSLLFVTEKNDTDTVDLFVAVCNRLS